MIRCSSLFEHRSVIHRTACIVAIPITPAMSADRARAAAGPGEVAPSAVASGPAVADAAAWGRQPSPAPPQTFAAARSAAVRERGAPVPGSIVCPPSLALIPLTGYTDAPIRK